MQSNVIKMTGPITLKMEWVDKFLSNPDQAAALGYGVALTASTFYAVYKNDFGAEDRTTAELKAYLENMDTNKGRPLKMWKGFEYRKELREREGEKEELSDGLYVEEERPVYADD